MIDEVLQRRDNTLVRRIMLEPGEATPWHVDPYDHFAFQIQGEVAAVEYRESGEVERLQVWPGQVRWAVTDPNRVVHRAVNLSAGPFEEIQVFFLDRADDEPQPAS
jgi:quercetin dioxygenase-like cupin family protein